MGISLTEISFQESQLELDGELEEKFEEELE
jgi:hypothetical protein